MKVSALTRAGFQRRTRPNRSSRPKGASTSMLPSVASLAAIAVAVSGQLAMPWARVSNGATFLPK